MAIFDFMHYLFFKFYSGFREKGALSTAAGIIGGFQLINVMSGIMLFSPAQEQKIKIEKWVVVVLFIIFQIYTYLRYIYRDDHSIEAIEQKWLNKSSTYRKQMRILIFIYGATSIFIVFGLALYLGGRN